MLASTAGRTLRPLGARLASSLALKYSQAAYSAALAKSPQVLTKVHGDLSTIQSTLSSTPALAEFVNNPTLSATERSEGLKQLFAAAEKKGPLDELTKNLFAVLSENGRLSETSGVVEGFNELVAKYKGELDVVVTSAEPLGRDVLANLEKSLKQSEAGKAAKTLKITNKVNPAILGGLVVDLGEKTIDLSVSNRVNKLNGLLQESV
ncbi:OSCP, subunit 5 of the stator stalk of mitochondrial F1F0 ATP synthase [Exidia glandulosa HHB12029]|uniref:ATP synthase subunit 5, mitochondrial n=2 Tax=Exidia glandulosa HHB12029 TaxID=1314781 RepID=A0A165CMX1_EXIGL|nr:OSCP, subunit 5 of the stator stalk of mitochondrial F1F0 ATP synthase [Exidia glandulosa HHB12029]